MYPDLDARSRRREIATRWTRGRPILEHEPGAHGPITASAISDQSSGPVGEARYARSGESSDQIDGREGRLPGVGGLLLQQVQHDSWGKVELAEEKFIGIYDLGAAM